MYNNQISFSDHYRALKEKVRSDIFRESEEQIIGTNTEELAKYFYDKYALSPIEEDSQREAFLDVQDYLKTIPAHQRERFYSQEGDLNDYPCQRAIVEIPILQNDDIQEIAALRTSTWSASYSPSEFHWGVDKISSTIETKGYGFDHDENTISQGIEQVLKRIRESIQWKNSDIELGNQELLVHIKNIIDEKKQKIAQNKEKIAALTKMINIPLKKKDDMAAQPVHVSQKPLVQRVKPKPTMPEEYVLGESEVNDIISFLDNQAKNYEQTPKALKRLGEEDLRDFLLANLNSIFEGNATGETFSKKGKTDIYLRISKGNILICECKIWDGKALYSSTIDQLRGYLTWRHNYGIMITFVRTKGFTKLLRESETLIQAHLSYINGFRKINDTHFVSNHKVDDEEKTVKIHHLFYHIPL